MSDLKKDGALRWNPSYLRRQGQITRAQRAAYRELWPIHGLEFHHGKTLDLGPIPVALEIGFGKGEHLLARAAAEPDSPFVGIEVHRPGIAAALIEIARLGLRNVRLIRGDARLVLADFLKARPLSSAYVLFPDPWPKPNDAHRRIIQADFLDLLASRLIPDGTLQIATDVPTYADHVQSVMAMATGWREIPITPRPLTTRYEEKGHREGRATWEARYQLSSDPPIGQ